MANVPLNQPTPAQTAAARPGFLETTVVASKAAVSAVLAVLCCRLLGLAQPVWAAVSAVVVSQASLHPSARDSIMRVLANLIGALVGAVLSVLWGSSLWVLALGVLLTGLICNLARLDVAMRQAYAAVVIVIFTSGDGAWRESRNRVFAVMIGCAATLATGLVHYRVTRRAARPELRDASAGAPSE